jgi:diguanylate cyclase (GGDEF)-like protein
MTMTAAAPNALPEVLPSEPLATAPEASGGIFPLPEPPAATALGATRSAHCVDEARRAVLLLSLSFAVLILLSLATFYWTNQRLGRIQQDTVNVLNRGLEKLELAHDGLRHSADNSRLTIELLMGQGNSSGTELQAGMAADTSRVDEVIASLVQLCDNAEEKHLLLDLQNARKSYRDHHQHSLSLLQDQRPQQARKVVVEETATAFAAYYDAWTQLLHFEMQQMNRALERQREVYVSTRYVGTLLVMLAAVLAVGIAFFVTGKIAADARARSRIYQQASRLNEELEQRVSERTSALASRDRQLQDSLGQSQNYASEIGAINELVKLLQSCLTLDEAREQASRVLQQFFTSGAVLMLNSSRNLLEVVLRWGDSSAKPGPFSREDCWALRKGEMHQVQPHGFNLLCNHTRETLSACHLCVPMMAQGESLGVLTLDDTGMCEHGNLRLSEQRRKLAATLAEQISLAFANLMLRETLKYQSVRDPLTALFNRRHMEEALQRELLRCGRNKNPLTVMMADVDHFKGFNDSFGHEAGDQLLRELGALLKSEIRGGDLACRYGGEEFLLIMVETSLDSGRQRAERLRDLVSSLHVRHRGMTLRQITVSIGIASFPECGDSASQLLSAADAALYQAKHNGRNRVVVSGDRPLCHDPA